MNQGQRRGMNLSTLVGRRVSLRYLLPDGQPTDVIGELLEVGEQLLLQPEWAAPVLVPASRVTAARAVPEPVIRPSSAIPKLAWLMDQGWPGLDRVRLGGWVARFGDGFTGRANSVLVLGGPGLPLPQAVDRVEQAYRARGLPPRFQLDHPLPGSTRPQPAPELAAELTGRGYRSTAVVDVLTVGLPETDPAPCDAVRLLPAPGPDWLDLYEPPGGHTADRATVTAVLRAGADPRFAELRTPDGTLAAAARIVLGHRWAGISALTVAPGLRRRGHGRTLLAALLHHAAGGGARFGYVQVEEENTAAHALHRTAGFTPHHRFEFVTRIR